MKSRQGILAVLIVLSGLVLLPAQTDAVRDENKAEVADWRFRDLSGTEHTVFSDPQTLGSIFVFVSTDCPIANGYQPTLQRLSKEFPAPKFQWYLVQVNPKLQPDQARQHAQEYSIELPVVIDTDQRLVSRLGATRIPEVMVLSRGRQQPFYQGRIDDLHVDFGRKRVAPTSHDLRDALVALRDHSEIQVRRTEVVGCSIVTQKSGPETVRPALEQAQVAYDPLQVSDARIESRTFEVMDTNRKRKIPIRVYLPQETSPSAVILFSHGLGGSRDNSAYLGKHWAGRGFVAVFLQHPGSDEGVWKGQRPRDVLNEMRKAASSENFSLRVQDVPAVIDQLEQWNQESAHPLQDRLDLQRIGMTGHSFGAVTTQAVAGQRFLGRAQFTDSRIKCAMPMSPSLPRTGSAERSFGAVAMPWLLMTGTQDVAAIGDITVENRLAVYAALPAGSKYELVLHEAAHSAFSERALPGDRGQRNPNHHRAILAISTAFWEAHLNQDSAARQWLDGDSVRNVLEAKDRWQRK